MNKKANEGLVYLILFLLILAGIGLFFVYAIQEASEFRSSKEGNCLRSIAKKICQEKGMEFDKIYAPVYTKVSTDGFVCEDRGKLISYEFKYGEENKCKGKLE